MGVSIKKSNLIIFLLALLLIFYLLMPTLALAEDSFTVVENSTEVAIDSDLSEASSVDPHESIEIVLKDSAEKPPLTALTTEGDNTSTLDYIASVESDETQDVLIKNNSYTAEFGTDTERIIGIGWDFDVAVIFGEAVDGNAQIGSAEIVLPDGFVINTIAEDLAFTYNTSDDRDVVWSGGVVDRILSLVANEGYTNYIQPGESFSVFFNIKAPLIADVYTIETKAWTDQHAESGTGNENNRAGNYTPLTISVNEGRGKFDEPFQINTAEQLDHIRYKPDTFYIQTADIDLGIELYSQGKGWKPIDNFTGSFDGGGYTINNLTINDPNLDYAGLFGVVSGARNIPVLEGTNRDLITPRNTPVVLSNINLGNVNIQANNFVGGVAGKVHCMWGKLYGLTANGSVKGHDYVGGLFGQSFLVNISDSHTDANVVGNHYVGGLAGLTSNGARILDSYSSGDVVGIYCVGGLIGSNQGRVINNSYATGRVTGNDFVGGLVGYNYESSIINSHAEGLTSGKSNIGGLVGVNDSGNISSCHAHGDVIGIDVIGGLVGWNYKGSISNSYADSSVSGVNKVGSLVGWNYGTIINCYATGSVNGTGNYVGGMVGFDGNYIPPTNQKYRLWTHEIAQIQAADIKPDHILIANLISSYLQTFTSSKFIGEGNRATLIDAKLTYWFALQRYTAMGHLLPPAIRASIETSLSLSWVAILALEAKLANQAGETFDLEALVDAYNQAHRVLKDNLGLLTTEEIAYTQELLSVIGNLIEALSV